MTKDDTRSAEISVQEIRDAFRRADAKALREVEPGVSMLDADADEHYARKPDRQIVRPDKTARVMDRLWHWLWPALWLGITMLVLYNVDLRGWRGSALGWGILIEMAVSGICVFATSVKDAPSVPSRGWQGGSRWGE